MNDWTFTITQTFSGETRQDAWDAWIEWLRDPNKVEAYTVIRSHEYDAVDRVVADKRQAWEGDEQVVLHDDEGRPWAVATVEADHCIQRPTS
jgi:hypothetical protein